MRTILVADDNEGQRRLIARALQAKGHVVREAVDGTAALVALSDADFDLVITDVKMPGVTGIELLQSLRRQENATPVIVMTAYGSIESAVEAMKLGASDYLTKPLSLEELAIRVERLFNEESVVEENRYLREAARGATGLLGKSASMGLVRDLISRVAGSDATVLITGESGTGKELVARALHDASARAKGPLVAINCAAIPETLLESELFGHERGAFTGAVRRVRGRFEVAHKGTLFLDEIGEVPLMMQVKLLRAVQEKTFERVGGEQPISIDVRIIAATNRELARAVAEGKFREDLYYRLRVIEVALPPLRERREDIMLLANHFAESFARKFGRAVEGFEPAAAAALEAYAWPGNVRELLHAVERAVVMGADQVIRAPDLPAEVRMGTGLRGVGGPLARGVGAAGLGAGAATGGGGVRGVAEVERALEDDMKARLIAALEEARGNKARAAEILGMKRSTYYFNLKKYGLL
ncbi:MAG: sigma-54-dependent Fis family transcriptional regulator [Deltaproteobacteria bacterium]|nr:sigma-54-dependent Fis family transcriptional regulator [Deltaproteobacteria bacterium]